MQLPKAPASEDDPLGPAPIRFPERRFSPIRNIGLRIAIAISALVVTTALVYLERDCYRDLDEMGNLTWIDALYYATVTLSTTGYGDITPVCDSARLTNALVITPLRFLFLIVLIGTTIEVLTRKTREQLRSNRWRTQVNEHTVIIGYGVKGRSAARSLLASGTLASRIVVVSPDKSAIESATRDGFVGVIGDGRREEVLLDAAIERAASVVVATDEDDTSVLVTLTARRLAPKATIVAAVRESQNADILRQSGANNVIPTAEAAGRLMGLSLVSSTAGEIMEDLLDSGRGLEVTERAIRREELGLSPGEIDTQGQIVLAVIRDGQAHRFDQNTIRTLQDGDRLVVIQHNPSED